MLQVNEYFDGKVKSIGYAFGSGKATVGVMAKGEYEFGTGDAELMRVISGKLRVQLPGSTEWCDYPAGTEFTVAPSSRFKLIVTEDSAYQCIFIPSSGSR